MVKPADAPCTSYGTRAPVRRASCPGQWLSIALAILCASLARQPPVLAQPAPPSEAAAADRAAELFEKGKALYRAQRLQEAYEAFQSAWELHRSYPIAANLGIVEIALGKSRSAAEHLSYALHVLPSSESAEKRATLEAHLSDAQKETAALRIEVSEQSAVVLVDGLPVGRSPLADRIFVEPGRHSIEARGANDTVARTVVDVSKGSSQELLLTLKSAPLSRVVTATTNATANPTPAPSRPDSKSAPLLVVGFGMSTLAAGIATAATVVSMNEAASAEELRSRITEGTGFECSLPAPDKVAPCQDLESTANKQSDFANVALYSFIAAGALSAATTVYALWPTPKPGKPAATFRVTLLPTVSPSGVGFVFAGEI